MHELARTITVELRADGHRMEVYVLGWNTLEERIAEHDGARMAFDPSFGPFSQSILRKTEHILLRQDEARGGFSRMETQLTRRASALGTLPGDATIVVDTLEAHLDAEVDTYRDVALNGRPRTALPLPQGLLSRLAAEASERIRFRLKANIASCLLATGERPRAATMYDEAYEHAPDEPKAVAGKAFASLLREEWRELLSGGREALATDQTNEGLAGNVVQAMRSASEIDEPLDLVPESPHGSASVAVTRVDFLRARERMPQWWEAARAAVAAHPDDQLARQFAAEADVDEALRDPEFRRTHLLAPARRARVTAAAATLCGRWDEARSGEGVILPEMAAVCCNLIVAYHALDDLYGRAKLGLLRARVLTA
ncbi:hypothetical protein P7D22_15410 [Lichenihabitans sp. Uapishka_5]|uniref:hypothetical protein n=1 Tax=Lichenihabitans sp. Uapishka_5 TaxID=3037302 RepID=UPI0029E7D77D|nr:hypothetical protein [Lichenihabitans sp. Uapishka_5]MDX7952557.1 hypothetical protein [Lichenihabitans sp. Uapishka_5]